MANRSTFSRILPRSYVKLAALSQTPSHYVKRQLVGAVDPITKAVQLDAEGHQKQVFQVLPDYDRMLRLLLINAHGIHKQFKLKRLAKEVGESKEETATDRVAEVA